MFRIVASSTPGAVERDESIRLLTKRAVLTRMVCREASECNGKFLHRRPGASLWLLGLWLDQNWPIELHRYNRYSTLGAISIPEDCQDLVDEIIDGGVVCDAISMIQTSDNEREYTSDSSRINDALQEYWGKHASPSDH